MEQTSYATLPINRVVNSRNTCCMSTVSSLFTAASKKVSVSSKIGGRASSRKILRLALLKKRRPAFLWILQRSPSALMMPFPIRQTRLAAMSLASQMAWSDDAPNRSHDLERKKVPLMKSSSFFSTCSTFFGSLMTMAGGRDGTLISKVEKPV